MSKTTMQIALTKVLATMDMSDNSKVLIALELVTDTQIGEFLMWLKDNIAEHQISSLEEEIVGKAIEISKEYV